jgi:hypothetical protein
MVDAVVTQHRDGLRSGVARFNELLAERLGVPLLGLDDPPTAQPLLSFKVAELGPAEEELLARRLDDATWTPELFLHEFRGLPLELRLVAAARRVHAGNEEIAAAVSPQHADVTTAWAPSLIRVTRPLVETELRVFSFGMAHKLEAGPFERLRGLLDATGRSYAVHVSAALHETASPREADAALDRLRAVFPDTLVFLGNLSDVAIADQLRRATFFAGFFERGARANNTSVAAAMENGGAVVVTNLDAFSPPWLVHGRTVVDVERCAALPVDEAELAALRTAAREVIQTRGWDALVATLRG